MIFTYDHPNIFIVYPTGYVFQFTCSENSREMSVSQKQLTLEKNERPDTKYP